MRRIKYIYQLKEWPNFIWDKTQISALLSDVRYQQGLLLGKMEQLGFSLKNEASYEILTQDVIKTSAIEGALLHPEQVRSSVAKRLGIETGLQETRNRDVEGIVEVLFSAISTYKTSLTKKKLLDWQAAIFPFGKNGLQSVSVRKWRGKESGDMQVVSGPYGREKIHFEAPHYSLIEKEMKAFIAWFNHSSDLDLVLKSAIAHLWFVTIHPFDDGNGRISRVLSDVLLARSEDTSFRFYSMSSQIQKERNSYYDILEKTQKGTLDISKWLDWYLNCLKRSISSSGLLLENVLFKAMFWDRHQETHFNDRQKKMINKLLDGFIGNLTSTKWAKICKCSQDTALRDINGLIAEGVLQKMDAGGRSTCYELVRD